MRTEGNAPKTGETNSRFLRHDNAPAHRSALAKDVLVKNNATTLEHPPYFPDLISADFYLPSTEINIEKTAPFLCYGHNSECGRRAEKAFTKWHPEIFPLTLQSLAVVYGCTRRLFFFVE